MQRKQLYTDNEWTNEQLFRELTVFLNQVKTSD